MKNIVRIALLLVSMNMFSQSFVETFKSEKLNNTREIRIKLPASYQQNPEQKYPMVFVFDSEFLFPIFEGNIQFSYYWDDLPEVILVGINQNKKGDRENDTEIDPATGLPTGKGASFFEFIGAELLPYLDKKYRTNTFKAVAGLDSSAALANTFLFKEFPLFNAYISLSPDLKPGMEEKLAKRLSEIQTPIYFYTATSDADLSKFQKQIRAFDQNMKAIKNDNVNYLFSDFKNANHYSVAAFGIPQALNQIFQIYQPISVKEYKEKIAILPYDHAKYLTDKYEAIEKQLGIKMNVRMSDFKAIETAIIKTEAWEGYEHLAQISGQQYEKTMLYDYHMANYWEKKGDLKKAQKFYQNAFTKQEIAGLTKDQMMNKAEDLKALMPKKDKLKGGKGKDKKTDELLEETPAEVPAEGQPTETPTETPAEEKPKEEPKN